MAFRDIIQGKSVAIIGGSNLLVGIRQGEYIDSHDVVVRVNLHWPCPIFYKPQRDVSEDIGKRTDIIFQALAAWRRLRFFNFPLPKLILLRGVASIIRNRSSAAPSWALPMYEQIVTDCEERGVSLQSLSPTYDSIYPSWSPNTGLLAIKCVMMEEPSSVYLAGFDFSILHNRAVNWFNHDPMADRNYIRDHVATDLRVKLHPIVRKAMDYEHPECHTTIKLI